MKTIMLLISTLLMISGCSDKQKNDIKEEIKQETSVYTLQYYLEHKDLRRQRLKECKRMIKGTLIQQKDCNNVRKAELRSRQNKAVKF